MKRAMLFCAVLALLLSVPALALEEEPAPPAEGDGVIVDTIAKEEEGVTVNVTIAQPDPVLPDAAELDTPLPEDASDTRTFSVTSLDLLEFGPSSGENSVMADVVVSILGEYQHQTYTVQETDADGTIIASSTQYVPGLAGLDYPWLAGAGLFALFLAGLLKLLGGLIRI